MVHVENASARQSSTCDSPASRLCDEQKLRRHSSRGPLASGIETREAGQASKASVQQPIAPLYCGQRLREPCRIGSAARCRMSLFPAQCVAKRGFRHLLRRGGGSIFMPGQKVLNGSGSAVSYWGGQLKRDRILTECIHPSCGTLLARDLLISFD